MHILTQEPAIREEQNWCHILKNSISDSRVLLNILNLSEQDFAASFNARKLFALRVPQPFVDKMEKGNPRDPLFLQVMCADLEFVQAEGFSSDPLEEQEANAVPNILHKYQNRLLFMVKGGCAVNCRYCFRRHFPYDENPGNKKSWQQALDYIAEHTEIEEVIFSGGDPLMAKDDELAWLIKRLENLPHLQRLRIHTRLPVVIPQRITNEFCEMLAESRLQTVMVSHINHPNEIDDRLGEAMQKLHHAGIVLLNQSVLLKGINDNAHILKSLSDKLFHIGILPYYLHLLDKVQGASHFLISDAEAHAIYKTLQSLTSGYLVPKLAREIAGEPNKTLYAE
ncbi:EF-P beta-lysylation protein EpmB [Rodentibacter trehalosifermentans]|uniref:L-lysine 2,3-aminomutase n=1 Tax=Rodentibacter trehalosifermentans TaxID=1908263 RepID=A0A1V3J8D3_9PAST|nr:EF-P beta-lysylation protein EpmB [Rodentibacter trehalosifermentans]OOF51469.1 EF-P beta-lysylation protein EpmB [Rodentibacter trehalosifermentans]